MTKPIQTSNIGSMIQDLNDQVESLNRIINSPPILVRPTYYLDWTEYINSEFGPVQYYRDMLGVVHMSGLLSKATAWRPGDNIIQLNENYWPRRNIVKDILADNRLERITIYSNGAISISGITTWVDTTSWISLDLSFSTWL